MIKMFPNDVLRGKDVLSLINFMNSLYEDHPSINRTEKFDETLVVFIIKTSLDKIKKYL